MKKTIIAAGVVLVLVGGYIGFTQYEQHNFSEAIRPHVKNSSLRLANEAVYATDKNTKITFKELFDKLESDIAEIDKRILEVQTLAAPSNREITDPVLEYLKGSQELLRALLTKYRKSLALSNASDWIDKAVKELETTNSYSYGYALKEVKKAQIDFKKAENEYSSAVIELAASTKTMKDIYVKAADVLPRDVLVDPAIFDKLYDSNEHELNYAVSHKGVP